MPSTLTRHQIIRYTGSDGTWEAEIDVTSRAQKIPGGVSVRGPNHAPYYLAAKDGARSNRLPKEAR